PLLDQLAHPARGPHPGGVSERLGSALERVFDLLELGTIQSGLAPSPPGLLQTRPTGLRKLPCPANHRLPMHPQAPRHLTLAHAPLKQFRCLHPAPLQRAEVPPHTCWITPCQQASICIYIIQDSIVSPIDNLFNAEIRFPRQSRRCRPTAASPRPA